MRVPACAIPLLITVAACGTTGPEQLLRPGELAAESCGRAVAPQGLDPRAGTWQLLRAQHTANATGQQFRSFDVLDACERFVSLAHSLIGDGKAQVGGPSEVLVSDQGQAWSTHALVTEPAGVPFRAIAVGDGRWVAVGHGSGVPGVIAASNSLEAGPWREVLRNDGFYFNSVAYGAGTFVAVATNGVAVSADGEQWRWLDLSGIQAQYFEVAFTAGRFVVAGVGATLTSLDGQTWDEMRCSDPTQCELPTPPPATCITAPCPATTPAPVNDYLALQRVRAVGERFYAFGASGTLESRDGLTFQPVTKSPDAAMGGVWLSMSSDTEATPPGATPTRVFASQDEGHTWVGLPLVLVDALDCREVPCVAVPDGVLAFIAEP